MNHPKSKQRRGGKKLLFGRRVGHYGTLITSSFKALVSGQQVEILLFPQPVRKVK